MKLRNKSKFIQAFLYLVGGLNPRINAPNAYPHGRASEGCLSELRKRYRQLQRGAQKDLNDRSPADPLVSVVLPVRSSEEPDKFLTAMRSLLTNQDAPRTEIVIVLNEKFSIAKIEASAIAGIVKEIGFRLITLSYIEMQKYGQIEYPRSIFVARQVGIEAAQGDIIIAADIDNIFSSQWIKSYADAFAQDLNLLLAYGPVGIHKMSGLIGALMSWISTISKAAKILINYPPYAGHNHAMRKEVIAKVPNLYTDHILLHENEIPLVLSKALSLKPNGSYITCVPKAIIKTDYSHLNQSLKGAICWFFSASKRNILQMKRLFYRHL